MSPILNISIFGSSLVSAYWNGAATYYRGLVRALAERGHAVTFFEPDAYQRQQHRDIPDPEWARVIVYDGQDERAAVRAIEQAGGSDVVIKASGVGVFDELLERGLLSLQSAACRVCFLDVDAPATLDRIEQNPEDPFRALIPRYDLIFTYGGGEPVVNAYRSAGARGCVPIYNALDPHTHFPVEPAPRFACNLGFLGNCMPDREARVEEFFFRPASLLSRKKFLLGGNGWQDKPLPSNVSYLGHVYTHEHNMFNCSALAVLNVNRDSMARYGFSPPTRVFEAAGAGACLITDRWEGIDMFLEPGSEVLVAGDGEAVARHLYGLTPDQASQIGEAARQRILRSHTYANRACQLELVLTQEKLEVIV